MHTKDKIYSTALELFNTEGYDNVGVREIARKLEMSPGNLSYHFPKKEDILFSILRAFRVSNNAYYAKYRVQTPTLNHFLELMKNIFTTQYQFRGVFVGNQFVQKEIQSTERFKYAETAKRRKNDFRKIFIGLVENKEMRASKSEIEFLVSFISLFGRFWIQEAFLLQRVRNQNEVITHYLNILVQQLSLFATRKGEKSIDRFVNAHQNT